MTSTEAGRESETVISVARVGKLRPEPSSARGWVSTSRGLWIASYILLMVLVALRLPLTRKYLNANVPADVRSEIGDDRLLSLSMTVGTVMFFLLYAVIIALYFSLAAFLDKRVIPGKSVLAGRVNIGAFFVIAIFATIPVNLFSVLFGVIQPRDVPGFWAYFPSTALVALALFYRHWRGFSTGRKILVVLSAIGLSTIVAIG
ncbi:hypothetical protein OIT41_05240 [Arthrobacter sp. YA7-1]|jgi:hypothetical protein|uniref:hypothetical protein n=1 Tax=Arthrobacter sp. YA7-1 TaxID=2987701 RepID=UPI0022264C59|nr:hypothetical protein [Arthrobacter sp. YA7-1]UYY82469.1 hypothetical protein OIT41_05240 [Arthrobacter sp. YA7-1]